MSDSKNEEGAAVDLKDFMSGSPNCGAPMNLVRSFLDRACNSPGDIMIVITSTVIVPTWVSWQHGPHLRSKQNVGSDRQRVACLADGPFRLLGRFSRIIGMSRGIPSTSPWLYFIEVLGIKVAGELLPISQSVFSSSGTIIDSGTITTSLQPKAYNALRTKFQQLMMNYTMTQGGSTFDTCYNFSDGVMVEVPKISFQFGGDVKVPIPFPGILIGSKELSYLVFIGNSDSFDMGIFGIGSSKLCTTTKNTFGDT
ncbi:aspartic proteinase nepenthesin-2-like [Rhododendron vialii]|uniref:aspartic proteinase nepenthesin-2-like n=1 Tax=Rhododendron vialii TaxID=182163 RepID=UPI00265E4DF1|nr:aspartic proteinase nepenthesin-2-like [Rhododendron vialii]